MLPYPPHCSEYPRYFIILYQVNLGKSMIPLIAYGRCAPYVLNFSVSPLKLSASAYHNSSALSVYIFHSFSLNYV